MSDKIERKKKVISKHNIFYIRSK